MLYDKRTETLPEVPATEEWRDILIKAKQIIETKGWTRGSLINDAGEVCLIGALGLAADGRICGFDIETIQRRKALREPIARLRAALKLRSKCRGLWVYNDLQNTSREAILGLIDDALDG